jgi:short-subunit dehydrogenase
MRQASSPFFSNALRFELAGSNVGVTVVHPGGVATKIAENACRHAGTTNAEMAEQLERARRVLTMPPEKALSNRQARHPLATTASL